MVSRPSFSASENEGGRLFVVGSSTVVSVFKYKLSQVASVE